MTSTPTETQPRTPPQPSGPRRSVGEKTANPFARFSWSAWPLAFLLATTSGFGVGYLLVSATLSDDPET
jgi:hypothetical protein